jgi:NitT/TauT family transport system permease protein
MDVEKTPITGFLNKVFLFPKNLMRFFFRCCKVTVKPGKKSSAIMPWILFAVLIGVYAYASYVRHKENPREKIMPSLTQMVQGLGRCAYNPDLGSNTDSDWVAIGKESGVFDKDDANAINRVSEMQNIEKPNAKAKFAQFKISLKRSFSENNNQEFRLLHDSIVSTKRFLIALGIIFFGGLFLGLIMRIPYGELLFYRFVLFFDKTPPLALLPILFIVFGLGEVSKEMLIVIAVVPSLALDVFLKAKAYPQELITKSMTLGAGTFGIIFRTILPQIFPDFLDSLRLKFKDIVAYLIIGESLAASVGLGYRIFVVQRYLAMDVIIPYVVWISFLAFIADYLVRCWIKKQYPWYNK